VLLGHRSTKTREIHGLFYHHNDFSPGYGIFKAKSVKTNRFNLPYERSTQVRYEIDATGQVLKKKYQNTAIIATYVNEGYDKEEFFKNVLFVKVENKNLYTENGDGVKIKIEINQVSQSSSYDKNQDSCPLVLILGWVTGSGQLGENECDHQSFLYELVYDFHFYFHFYFQLN